MNAIAVPPQTMVPLSNQDLGQSHVILVAVRVSLQVGHLSNLSFRAISSF